MRVSLFLFVIILFISRCSNQNNNHLELYLLPSVSSLSISDGSYGKPENIKTLFHNTTIKESVLKSIFPKVEIIDNSSKADILLTLDESANLDFEEYSITIKTQIDIKASDKGGILYGLSTFNQIFSACVEQKTEIPRLKILDKPALKYRAIHLDVKHHLETENYYYELMDELMALRINAIIIEIEDKLKYELEPAVGSEDARTIEQWRSLSEYAIERNIEISPLVQGIGHASFILKNPEYHHLRDNPDSDWAFNPLDSQTYKVQFNLYRDALSAFPHARYLHVGGDEVHTTGRGSGKSNLELQLYWLSKVSDFAEMNGKTPIFWDDMPLKNAGLYGSIYNKGMNKEKVDSIWKENEPQLTAFLDQFPKNCIYMRWNYSIPKSYGNEKAMGWFMDNGFQVMGATAGQTRWVLMPQNESNIENIKAFAESSINKNIDGLLLTLWDDDSPHFELYKRGISAFAEYTWAGIETSNEEIKKKYRANAFGLKYADAKFAFIDSLEKPVAFWKNSLLDGNRNNLIKMNDPSDAVIELPFGQNPGEWTRKYEGKLKSAEKMLEINNQVKVILDEYLSDKNLKNKFRIEVYNAINEITTFNNRVLILLKEWDSAGEINKETKLKKIKSLRKEFELVRRKAEQTFGKTRVLYKPDNYILDQDHHVHLANQTQNFDWQFYAEQVFFNKLEKEIVEIN